MTVVLQCGCIPYADYLTFGRALAAARAAGAIEDLVLFATHPPVITLGRQSQDTELRWDAAQRAAAGLEVVAIERGGNTTYHGPDQQMLYPVRQLEFGDLHAFVRQLQEVVVFAAAAMGVTAFRKDGYPGVWTSRGKLASLGLALKQRVTLHGLALNCDPATSGGFEAIIPCGLQDVVMTDLATETGYTIGRMGIRAALATGWEMAFGERLETQEPIDCLTPQLLELLPDPLPESLAAPLPEGCANG